jgi:hypothetical protein
MNPQTLTLQADKETTEMFMEAFTNGYEVVIDGLNELYEPVSVVKNEIGSVVTLQKSNDYYQ